MSEPVIEEVKQIDQNQDQSESEILINGKEITFADAILQGESEVDATIIAGYMATDNFARERQASFLLSLPHIKKYMEGKERIPQRREVKNEIISYDSKLKILKEILEITLEKLKSSDDNYKQMAAFAKIVIDIVRVTNEMQGHISASKLMTANFNMDEDSDIKKVNATLQDLTRKYDRGF